MGVGADGCGVSAVNRANEITAVRVISFPPAGHAGISDVNEPALSTGTAISRWALSLRDLIIGGGDWQREDGPTDVGDRVQLISPHGTMTARGMFARPRSFAVAGVFRLGLYQLDSEYGFIMMPVARHIFGEDQPIFLQLRVDDMFKSNEVVDAIVDRFGAGYTPRDWTDKNKSLFSALRQEKIAIAITVGLIVMVATLNIIASLILLVMEKGRDIAILKTMGSPASSIRWIFMLQGLIIGLVGTTVGAIAGGALVFLLDRFRLIPVPEDLSLSLAYVAFKLQPFDFAVVVTSAVAICFVATIYPSRQAARLDPAQALRYQ